MRVDFCLLVMTTAALSAGFTDQQLENARIWAHQTNDAFEACLQTGVHNKLPLKMTREDFTSFIEGACAQEKRAFRVLLTDYLTMKEPDIDAATHAATAAAAVQQWRDAAVQLYIELTADGAAVPSH
jgi:hypothetical protein